MILQVLGPKPANTQCPECGHFILTKTEPAFGMFACVSSTIFCVLGWVVGGLHSIILYNTGAGHAPSYPALLTPSLTCLTTVPSAMPLWGYSGESDSWS